MAKKKKHILLISPFAPPNLGGIESHLEDLYQYLRKNGYQVTLLTYQPLSSNLKAPAKEEKRNLKIIRYRWFGNNLFITLTRYPPIFNFLYLTPYLLLRSFLFMLFHYQRIDVVHCFGLNPAFIGRVMKLFFKKRTIMSFANLYDFQKETLFGKICYWVLKEFDKILVSSQASKKDVLKLGLPKNKVVVYTHWINLKHFQPGDKKKLKKKLGWQDKFTVLFVGRMIPEKGVSLVLKIAKKIKKDVQFKLIGDDGPELPKVKKAQQKLANLEYLGKITNDKIGPFYAAADVFVYPALYDEDLALVLLESLACGTPVINTNPGSGVYRLKRKFSFVIPASPRTIQEKIEWLYDHPRQHQKMCQEGIKFAQNFGPQLAKKIATHY